MLVSTTGHAAHQPRKGRNLRKAKIMTAALLSGLTWRMRPMSERMGSYVSTLLSEPVAIGAEIHRLHDGSPGYIDESFRRDDRGYDQPYPITGDEAAALILHGAADCRPRCIVRVQVDHSGCWRDVDPLDLPANIALEIDAEVIDGGRMMCDDFLASNGQHYRW